jgi:hypothetical protein
MPDSTFVFCWDDGHDPENEVKISKITSCFHSPKATVQINTLDREDNGQTIVDRGHLLLQRDALYNSVSLAFYNKDARNDMFPKLVIPLGFVVATDFSIVKSLNGHKTFGRVRLATCCSIDTLLSVLPMRITILLSDLDELALLDEAITSCKGKWPQEKLTFFWDDKLKRDGA